MIQPTSVHTRANQLRSFQNGLKNPYLEAHHLIPLGLEHVLGCKVDFPENIFAINPLWHRAIHHAEPTTVRVIRKRHAGLPLKLLASYKR
jgi:hypothetical protein